MEHLVIGLYVLSLLSCCLCLWFWWELESAKEQQRRLDEHMRGIISRLDDLGGRRR